MDIGHSVSRLAGKLFKNVHAGDSKLAAFNDPAPVEIPVTASSFVPGGPIPARHAGEDGVAPALHWRRLPAGTKEVVVLCEDPDAPFPKPFVHWLVYGLPPETRSLPEGADNPLPGGALQGKNSAGGLGYTGPKPPPGHGVHHYHFQVFALDERLGLGLDAERDDVVECMRGHVLASGEVVGTFVRH